MIDLRSDTVTRPTPEMRRAIAEAEVGDDVYHDDPTVNRLEERVAAILGMEAAVFVPTGTMANQIALRLHTQPGDIVLAEAQAHVFMHEMGAGAALSGVTVDRLPGTRGVVAAETVRAAIPMVDPALPASLIQPITLLCIENTHNEAGGTVWPQDELEAIHSVARESALATHLDGARLWNAAAATDAPEAQLAAGFDTVSVCFSKGLGAPVGSALAGRADDIARARRIKHMFGGGFRQAGVLAAGAIHALEHHRGRLREDHANARWFGESLASLSNIDVDLDCVQTNMVYFTTPDATGFVVAARDAGVDMLAIGSDRIRAVFHLDVTSGDTKRAFEILADLSRSR